MYNVSQAYKTAAKSSTRLTRITGTVGEHSFTTANIMAGSFSITNQCSSDSEITLGSVYIGELKVTFMGLLSSIPRYQWEGLVITPYFGICIDEEQGTYEDVPLGVYVVAEAEWMAGGISIRAYDYMSKFDKKYDGTQVTGAPWTIIQYICHACDMECGNTQAEIEAMANGDELITLYENNDVETWRDVVSWLAVTLGGLATMDRTGKLVFKAFGDTVVDTLSDVHRHKGASFSDFITRYTGISYVETETQYTHYFSVDPDDGLTYNIGTNPFMQYGLIETRDAMAVAILQSMQAIHYVPFRTTVPGNPAYDLGDIICFSDGIADATKISCITKYTFKYSGEYVMEGAGKNPMLASARSKVDKNIAGLLSRVDASTAVSIGFVNTEEISIPSISRKTILSIAFATVSGQSKVDIWIEVLFNLTIINSPTPGKLRVQYYLNSNELEYSPRETYDVGGYHILTLHYYFGNLEENTRYTFLAAITLDDASAVIAAGNVHAFLQGFGLVGEGSSWDGTIEASDIVAPFTISAIPLFGEFTDTVNSVSVHTPLAATAADYIAAVAFEDAGIIGAFTDSSSAVSDLMVFSPWTNGSMVTTDATVTAGTGWVGSGDVRLDTAAELVTDEVTYADSVDITGSVDSLGTAFMISPDGGDTWYGWQNGAWVQNYKMSFYEFLQLTSAEWHSMDSVALKVFLGGASTIYSLNLYGSDADIEWLYRYIMSTAEGNKVFNPVYVSDDNGFQMITDYDYTDSAETVDSGYLRSMQLNVSGLDAVNTMTVNASKPSKTWVNSPLYCKIQHNYSDGQQVWTATEAKDIIAINIELKHTNTNFTPNAAIATTGTQVGDDVDNKRTSVSGDNLCGEVNIRSLHVETGQTVTFSSAGGTSTGQAYLIIEGLINDFGYNSDNFLTPRDNVKNHNHISYSIRETVGRQTLLMLAAQFSGTSGANDASLKASTSAAYITITDPANYYRIKSDYGAIAIAEVALEPEYYFDLNTADISGAVGNMIMFWTLE